MMKEFESKLADLLEVEEVKDSDELREFECWDSLTVLSIIALVAETFRLQISAKDIKVLETVGDLKAFLQSKK